MPDGTRGGVAGGIRSVGGRLWDEPNPDMAVVASLVDAGASAPVAEILATRGVVPADVAEFLRPRLRASLPNPFFFVGMREGADRIATAVQSQEKVAIWGDYDVDGATSSALAARFLREAGASEVTIKIPDRILEGYGPNIAGLRDLQASGHTLCIMLDCGTAALEPLALAHAIGLDVVVIDHHLPEADLPPAVAVINPNRHDQEKGQGHLCAVGMTFVTMVGVSGVLRDRGWWASRGGAPDLMALLDLVALGTVADVVPLVGANRAFVYQGLQIMAASVNPGIRALMAVSGLKKPPTADDLGWRLGPRINAGGRIGEADGGARLLSATDPAECAALADKLNQWNSKRQEIEKGYLKEAMAMAEAQVDEKGFLPGAIVVCGTVWHQGVIGILAGRLKEAFQRPTFVFTDVGNGRAKGSGRSVKGFHLGDPVIAARQAGLLVYGGGHEMAAGATIETSKIDDFRRWLMEAVERSGFAPGDVPLEADLVLKVREASLGLVEAVRSELEPCGTANGKPRVLVKGGRLVRCEIVGNGHLKIEVADDTGASLSALRWGAGGTEFDAAVQGLKGQRVDLLGELDIEEFRGRRTVLMLRDVRLAE